MKTVFNLTNRLGTKYNGGSGEIKTMQSIKEIFKIGPGPSSSHTFGPMRASEYIKQTYPNATEVRVTLYGSLALTGRGHLTDMIIKKR